MGFQKVTDGGTTSDLDYQKTLEKPMKMEVSTTKGVKLVLFVGFFLLSGRM